MNKVTSLYYWLKVFTEGKNTKDKILLIPSSILRVILFSIRFIILFVIFRVEQLSYRCIPEVIIENRLGLFKCRGHSSDISIVAEANEKEFTKYLLSKRPNVFVDIGANVGRYTIAMAKVSNSVVSIECDHENYEALLKNIELNNLHNVFVVERACWDKETILPMIVPPLKNKCMGSLVLGDNTGGVKVRCSTLDSILNELGIKQADLIKIDIEGAEKEAILGCRNIISNSTNIEIIFEVMNEQYLRDCKDALSSVGINNKPILITEGLYSVTK